MGGGRGGCKREVCVGRREVHRDKEDNIVGVVVSQDSVTTHLLVCIIIKCSVSLALQFCLIIITLGTEAGEEEGGGRDGRREERRRREKRREEGEEKRGGRREERRGRRGREGRRKRRNGKEGIEIRGRQGKRSRVKDRRKGREAKQ